MKKRNIVLLLFFTPLLAILLAYFGYRTLSTNPTGWFLLLTGVVYFFGLILVVIIFKRKFWESESGGGVKKDEQNDRSFWLISAGMAAVFFISPMEFLYFRLINQQRLWLAVMGMVLIILGSCLFMWARLTLKRAYSGHLEVKTEQPLIQGGPYRVIRHPAYAGYLLMALGVAVGYASIAGILAYAFLLLPGTVYRIKVEEKLLEQGFGEDYRIYQAKTKRIIPRIW